MSVEDVIDWAAGRKRPFNDISGKKFSRLTAIRPVGKSGTRSLTWLCSCECGGEKIVSAINLRRGATKSCGCVARLRSANKKCASSREARPMRLHGPASFVISTIDAESARRFASTYVRAGEDECWNCKVVSVTSGRGRFTHRGRRILSSRVAVFLATGTPPPDALLVLHSCDNPACVNPKHLSVGTYQDNANDRVNRNRGARGATHYSRTKPEAVRKGEAHHKSRLTASDVELIRASVSSGEPKELVAARFAISAMHVKNICSGHRWKHTLPKLQEAS